MTLLRYTLSTSGRPSNPSSQTLALLNQSLPQIHFLRKIITTGLSTAYPGLSTDPPHSPPIVSMIVDVDRGTQFSTSQESFFPCLRLERQTDAPWLPIWQNWLGADWNGFLLMLLEMLESYSGLIGYVCYITVKLLILFFLFLLFLWKRIFTHQLKHIAGCWRLPLTLPL